ncbi:MAG: hypothetical protein WC528_04380 [Patescibacteria group bacterium]
MSVGLKKNAQKFIFLVIVPVLLVILNIYIIYPLFSGDYNQNISSIEVAFFTDAKFIYDHFPHLTWMPDWYIGFPFHNIYTPFLPFMIALLHWLVGGVTFAHFYRILMALFYIIGPVSLYFFVRYLTGRHFAGLFAAIGYSILPSFSYLIGGTSAYGDMIHRGPVQLVILQVFGEGPHLAALSLAPLAALAFLWALRQPKFSHHLLAAVAIGLVGLINWFGLVTLILMLLAVWLSEIFKGEGGRKTKNTITIFSMAYGLIAFWFNLSFIKSSLGFGGGGRAEGDILANYLKLLPMIPILLPVIVALGWLLSKKIKKLPGLFVGLLWLIIFLIVTVSWYRWGIAFLPQPPRFLTEVNLAAFIVLAIFQDGILKKILPDSQAGEKKIGKGKHVFGGLYVVLVLLAIFYFSRSFLANPHDLLKPHEDITKTYPFEVAKFLDSNVSQNERVLASGNIAFWLDYFSDVSQVKGAADQAATHPFWSHAIYQITTGENAPEGRAGEMALVWLKALNANYIVVNTPLSHDPFYDFKDPEKFETLEKVYESQGDVVYAVPLTNPSLAQVVDEDRYGRLEAPTNGVDYQSVKAYADWVDKQAKPANFNWINNDTFEIQADVNDGDLVSAQITFDKGWQITGSGHRLKTAKDVMGNLVIFPRTSGQLIIRGRYKNTWDVGFGYLITLVSVVYCIITLIRNRKKYGIEKREKK